MKRYRIVIEYGQYVAQVRRWYGWTNLLRPDTTPWNTTRAGAERLIDQHAAPTDYVPQAWQRGSAP